MPSTSGIFRDAELGRSRQMQFFTFTFVMCCRPSVCLSSVTFVRLPSRMKFSAMFLRRLVPWLLAILWHPRKTLRRPWPRLSFAQIFGTRKLDSLCCHVVLFAWSTFSRFSRTPSCDRQTVRHTLDYGIYRVGLRASGNLPVSYVLTGKLPVTYHQ